MDPVVVDAGGSVQVQVVADDVDDDKAALIYKLNNAPEGMQVSETGLVTWSTQSGTHSGEYTADVVVTDPLGTSASQQLKVVVNGAPVVESVDSLELKIGDKVEFTVAASDPEGGKLSYKALNNPDGFKGSSGNGLNGKFNWTTKDAGAGDYKIDIEVADAAGLKSVVFVQVTLKSNVAPTIEPLDPVVVDAGGSVQVQVVADDVDDDKATLIYKLNNVSEGMQVSETGLVTWSTQSGTHSGEYTADVVVTDPLGASASQQLKVVVNGAPVVESVDPINVKIGDKVEFTVVASDPEGGKLSYKALNNPDGFKGGGGNGLNGKFNWTTKDAGAGDYKIDIEVADAAGLKSVVSVQVTLKSNVAPTIESMDPVVVDAGGSVQVQVVADDVDDDKATLIYKLNNVSEGMQVSETGLVTWSTQSGTHSGEYTADVVVTDPLGASASQQLKVVVNGAPVVESVDPINVKIGDKVEFTVVASDPEGGKLSYKALNNPDGFKGGGGNGLNGKFNWTTKDAGAGDYKIDIEVADAAGLKSVVSVQVTLKSNVAPTIEPMDPVVVDAGGSVQVQVVADDPDGDNTKLKYLLEDAPAGMQISGSGLIQWAVPGDAEDATYSVTVSTVDDRDGMASRVLEVTIERATTLTLLSSPAVVGPFDSEVEAVIDESGQTITVAKAGGMRFYKLQSGDDTKLKITSIAIKDDNVVMSYKPAGE
jgi:plastocyanin